MISTIVGTHKSTMYKSESNRGNAFLLIDRIVMQKSTQIYSLKLEQLVIACILIVFFEE